jgi:hypothetical protein
MRRRWDLFLTGLLGAREPVGWAAGRGYREDRHARRRDLRPLRAAQER